MPGERMAQVALHGKEQTEAKSRQGLVLGALGVVYGDIGTSPLYTVKQCFDSIGTMTPAAFK